MNFVPAQQIADNAVRAEILRLKEYLTAEQWTFFGRMYGQDVDSIPSPKLPHALDVIQRTLKKRPEQMASKGET